MKRTAAAICIALFIAAPALAQDQRQQGAQPRPEDSQHSPGINREQTRGTQGRNPQAPAEPSPSQTPSQGRPAGASERQN